MEKEKLLITPDMLIGDIIRLKPRTLGVLMNFGLGCVGCPASQMESLEQAAAVHGLDLDFLVEALNK
ncbi:MAG: DUF1858 domain-containing protein [Tissierellia bacterium]|nr:DUF1858 domain-containing protein [Tissierellia bacterium]